MARHLAALQEEDNQLFAKLGRPKIGNLFSSINKGNDKPSIGLPKRLDARKPAFIHCMESNPEPPNYVSGKSSSGSTRPPSMARGIGRGRPLSSLESKTTIPTASNMGDDPDLDRLPAVAEKPDPANIVADRSHVFDDYYFGDTMNGEAAKLPIRNYIDIITKSIDVNQVVVIQGSTGCGKSTQVPQFLLDKASLSRTPFNCVVTQPRRIAAISLAERVSKERGWELGSVVGYQVGLDRRISDDCTMVQYVTTGVLLERLIRTQSLNCYSHVILDEVHERDVDIDLCMLIIKELMATNTTTKLILMSATVAANRIAEYFSRDLRSTDLAPQPECIISIDGPVYPIEEFHLEEMIEQLGVLDTLADFPPELADEIPQIDTAKRQLVLSIILHITDFECMDQGVNDIAQLACGTILIFLPGMSEITELSDYIYGFRSHLEQETEFYDQQRRNQHDRQGGHHQHHNYNHHNHQQHNEWRHNQKMVNRRVDDKTGGSRFNTDLYERVKPRLKIMQLHSSIGVDEQHRVFDAPKVGERKVILSTNIAESSITVPDIKYIIDLCMTKRLRHDRETNFSSLRPEWASQSNLIQRRGRAGRTSPGQCYRLIRKDFFHDLDRFCPSEMSTGPLEQVVLRIKEFGRDPRSLLSRALDPPEEVDIGHTMVTLKETAALTVRRDVLDASAMLASDHWTGDLSFIGRVMACLPVDIHVGKLIALGYVLDVFEDILTVGACMASSKSVFATPFQGYRGPAQGVGQTQYLDAFEKKLVMGQAQHSDSIAMLNAFKLWSSKLNGGSFRSRSREETSWCRERYLDVRGLVEVDLLREEMRRRLSQKLNITRSASRPNIPAGEIVSQNADLNVFLIKLAIAGAFYPNYFIREHNPSAEEMAARMFGGRDPARCVEVSNLPMGEGNVYRQVIADQFNKYCMKQNPGRPRVSCHDTKAVIEFPPPSNPNNPMDSNVVPENSEDSIVRTNRTLLQVLLALRLRRLPRLRPTVRRVRLTGEMLDRLSALRAQNRLAYETLKTADPSAAGTANSKLGKHIGYPALHVRGIQFKPTHVARYGSIFGIYAESEHYVAKIAEAIDNDREQVKGLRKLTSPKVSQLCLAPFEEDFYRSRIMQIKHRICLATVYFVDYGNTETISVDQLYQMSRAVDQAGPHLAVEMVLAELKPHTAHHLDGHFDSREIDWLTDRFQEKRDILWTAEIYSVVTGQIRIRLEKPEGMMNDTINNELIKIGFAEFCEEPYSSREDHAARMKLQSLAPYVVNKNTTTPAYNMMDPEMNFEDCQEVIDKEKALLTQFALEVQHDSEIIRLGGPDHPHEMAFHGLTRSTFGKKISIAPESINCVLVDEEPQNPVDRLLIAGLVQSSPHNANELVLRQTTLMPHLQGLPALLTLIFAPIAEFRTDSERTRYSGAICGLGFDNHKRPVHPNNDIELVSDVRLDWYDQVCINDIRHLFNYAFGSSVQLHDTVMLDISEKLREQIPKLFFSSKRDLVTRVEGTNKYDWLQIPREMFLDSGVQELGKHEDPRQLGHRLLFLPHCGIIGVNGNMWKVYNKLTKPPKNIPNFGAMYEDWASREDIALDKVARHLERLLASTTDNDLGSVMICELCFTRGDMPSPTIITNKDEDEDEDENTLDKVVNSMPHGFVIFNRQDLKNHLASPIHRRIVEELRRRLGKR